MIMNTTIFESGTIQAAAFDTDYTICKVGFTDGATGLISLTFVGGQTAILPIEVVQTLSPRVKMINTTGSTVLITDVYVGIQ